MHATSLLYQGKKIHIPEATFLNFSFSVKGQDMILLIFNIFFNSVL